MTHQNDIDVHEALGRAQARLVLIGIHFTAHLRDKNLSAGTEKSIAEITKLLKEAEDERVCILDACGNY